MAFERPAVGSVEVDGVRLGYRESGDPIPVGHRVHSRAPDRFAAEIRGRLTVRDPEETRWLRIKR
jgi:hypothetical protein